jgi:hypothetical protein
MTLIEEMSGLTQQQIEDIEKLTLRWIFQATLDFGMQAHEVFLNSPDDVQDIAEDVTREILDRLPGFNVQQRIYGKMDYKKARYVILPDQIVRQALFVDAKAEKDRRTATLQMSQISMEVRQNRAGRVIKEIGFLPHVCVYSDKQYLTTTAFIHFFYEDTNHRHHLRLATIFCVPNGKLQDRYNPSPDDGIWLAGRDAPTRGEDFRVRIGFSMLTTKSAWRVQRVEYGEKIKKCSATWRV